MMGEAHLLHKEINMARAEVPLTFSFSFFPASFRVDMMHVPSTVRMNEKKTYQTRAGNTKSTKIKSSFCTG
jgi:hypothetical protein